MNLVFAGTHVAAGTGRAVVFATGMQTEFGKIAGMTQAIGNQLSPLQKEIQVAWIGMLERYRRPVVDKLLERRCAAGKASSVRFNRSCKDTDGSALPDSTVSLDCKSGKLAADDGAAAPGAGSAEEASP